MCLTRRVLFFLNFNTERVCAFKSVFVKDFMFVNIICLLFKFEHYLYAYY